MNFLNPFILSIVMVLAVSCASGKQPSTDPGTTSTADDKTGETSGQPVDSLKLYDLHVSFFSIAYGIDREARIALNNLIDEYTNERKLTVIVDKAGWGREGEVDYCIDLQNLNDKEKEEFINTAKQYLSSSKLVHIKENAPCPYLKR